MSGHRFNSIEDEGVLSVGLIFNREFRWIFREQLKADMGIDAHVEICDQQKPLGKLLALQIKSGESWFKEQDEKGYIYRGSIVHLEYWTSHSLPVVLILYNPQTRRAYWQTILDKHIERTGKNWKISVPHNQILDETARATLSKFANFSPALHQLRQILLSDADEFLEDTLLAQLQQIAAALEVRGRTINIEELTIYQVIALEIIKQIRLMGTSMNILRPLYFWLQEDEVCEFAIRLIATGHQAFLIIGADAKPAIWSAFDLADYLYLGAEERNQAEIVICINRAINNVLEKSGHQKYNLQWNLFYTYREYIRRIERIWDIPKSEPDNE